MKKLLALLLFVPGWLLYALSSMMIRNKKIIIFGTHTNSFTGNIKALLVEASIPSLHKIFIGSSKAITQKALDEGIEAYWRYSLQGIWYSLRGGIYIYSSYPSDINYWLSAGAKYVNVWHGTPLKKIERDVDKGYYSLRNRYIWLFAIIAPYQFAKPDILLTASPYEKECFKSAFNIDETPFLEIFPPRLNTLLSYEDDLENTVLSILYAPTRRDDHSFCIEDHIDIDILNDFLIVKNIQIFCKPHPSDKSDYTGLTQSPNITLASKDDDIYILLAKSQILITDYSSMIFEALYLHKDVVLFCPDYSAYQQNSRSFYQDPCKEMDLQSTQSTEGLIVSLENVINSKNTSALPKAMTPYNLSTNTVEKSTKGYMMYDYLIIGAGFAGSVMAQQLATQKNKKVHILERRSHIGGNCYDEVDSSGVIVHRYGPHLFHTDNTKAYKYLQQFSVWEEYTHKVKARVDTQNITIPFSFTTLYEVFDAPKADMLKEKLTTKYGEGQRVSVLDLRQERDSDLKALGDFVFEKIFVNYTAKQWGISAEDIDPSVLARVPMLTSYDDRYFQDKHQALPKDGYAKIFENMLDHPNISIELKADALQRVSINAHKIYLDGKLFEGQVIYTGMVDELFRYSLGKLPYRSLKLDFEIVDKEFYQEGAVINYPNEHDYTRITEFKHIHPTKSEQTTILKEYPKEYVVGQNIPYYPIPTNKTKAIYKEYQKLAEKVDNLILLGRLAEYRYYDMDDIVAKALEVFEELT